MAHQVSWIVQYRVLYIGLSDEVTLDDFRGSTAQAANLMDDAHNNGSSGIIIGIVDLQEARLGTLMRTMMTTLVQEIASVIDSRVWKAKPGFIILITTSDAAKLLSSLIIRLSAQPMTSVGTLAEALNVISSMYPELQTELDAYRDSQQSVKHTN